MNIITIYYYYNKESCLLKRILIYGFLRVRCGAGSAGATRPQRNYLTLYYLLHSHEIAYKIELGLTSIFVHTFLYIRKQCSTC